jgi:ankyrin repeat protein
MASQNGHFEVVKLLLNRGTDVDVQRTTEGAPPLFIAVQNSRTELVKLLLKKGAHVNTKVTVNQVGWTPLRMQTSILRLKGPKMVSPPYG